MPIFDFRCNQCKSIVELLVRATDIQLCIECGSTLEKLVSRPAAAPSSGKIIASVRAQAKREGHFSNYSKSEKKGKI